MPLRQATVPPSTRCARPSRKASSSTSPQKLLHDLQGVLQDRRRVEEVAAEEDGGAQGAAAPQEVVKLHPTMIQEKAAIIVEHFREHTAKELGGRAKAMVVTDSRAAAVRYKRAVDHHIKEHKYQDIHCPSGVLRRDRR